MVRCLLGLLAAVLLAQGVAASPAAAHAELVSTTPGNGERLPVSPAEVTLQFTEGVGLVEDGLELLDGEGEVVATPEPEADGAVVRWPMPAELPDGQYLVSWRVVSTDGHPITGAFSFGVGEDAPPVTDDAGTTGISWPVTAARFAGYLGFALAAGAVALLVFCWPHGRSDPVPQRAMRGGFLLVGLAAVAAFLLQGPYAAGEPFSQVFDRSLIATTGNGDFGVWTQLRVLLCLAVGGILWPSGALQDRSNRWIGGVGVALVAVTFTGTGHAVTDPVWARAVDAVHALSAGSWAGGLAVLAVAHLRLPAAARPGLDVIGRFSRVALVSVVLIVVTGTVNSVTRLSSFDQLWATGYGRVLLGKVVLVAAVVAVAAVSRRRVAAGGVPWRTIRVEAVTTVVVLAVAAVLASVAPPPTRDTAGPDDAGTAETAVELPLLDGDTALLRVSGDEVREVEVELLDADGEVLDVRRVEVSATLQGEDVGPVPVDLRERELRWTGPFDPPLPGVWTFTVTVERSDRTALVTSGRVTID